MTRLMAKELGGANLHANVFAPGITLTDACMTLMEDAKTYGADRAALKRNGEVDDISGGVLYLNTRIRKRVRFNKSGVSRKHACFETGR